MSRVVCALTALVAVGLAGFASGQTMTPKASQPAPASAPRMGSTAGPVVVVETSKGTFEFETYPAEALKTVEHVLALVRRGFYNGQRFYRVEPGFVIQAGDPQTRDMTKRTMWGKSHSFSGKPVGVAEFSRKRPHVKGAVGMAHGGKAEQADAQFYVMLAARPGLNGKYVVFGQVINGHDVPAKIQIADMIKKMYVKEPTPKK